MIRKNKLLNRIYVSSFVFAVHYAFLSYINSSFLSDFVEKKYVGLIYITGALLSIIFLNNISYILNKYTNFRIFTTLLILEFLSLLGMAFISSAFWVISIFIFHYAFLIILKFNFDIFLEHLSEDKKTGNIRGVFLTSINLAIFISPIIVGSILSNSDFWKIYFLSALLLIPVFMIIYLNFKHSREDRYDQPPFWQTLKNIFGNKNILLISIIGLILNFFYSWMVIYTPIYLNQYIGFSWAEIGKIFTIMLMPFVILELPLGKIADKWLGEKEFLLVGFFIAAASTIAISFLESKSFFYWALILLITRIGISFVEIMSESFFFKHVDGTDTDIIGFFRNLRPMAYILGPLTATILLIFTPYRYLFIFLGLILFSGIYFSYKIQDTK